jgi:inner membrane protein
MIYLSPGRVFWPYRPIQVSPISPARFLTDGLPVILSELVWVWLPCLALVIAVRSWTDCRAGFGTKGG